MTRISDGESLYMPTKEELDDTPHAWRLGLDVTTSSVAIPGADGLRGYVGIVFADPQGLEFFAMSPTLARAVAHRLLERADLVDGFNA